MKKDKGVGAALIVGGISAWYFYLDKVSPTWSSINLAILAISAFFMIALGCYFAFKQDK